MANEETKSRTWIVEIEDAEGQSTKWNGLDRTDDTEGQGARGNWLKPEDDDTQGQGIRSGFLKPEDDDSQGHYSYKGLRQTEDGTYLMEIDTDLDASGQV